MHLSVGYKMNDCSPSSARCEYFNEHILDKVIGTLRVVGGVTSLCIDQ